MKYIIRPRKNTKYSINCSSDCERNCGLKCNRLGTCFCPLDAVQVIGKFILLRNGLADLIQLKGMVYLLQKQVAAVKTALFMHGNQFRLFQFQDHFPALFFFLLVELLDILPGPFIGISAVEFFTQFFFGSQFFNNHRSVRLGFTVVYGLDYIEGSCILRSGYFQSHSILPSFHLYYNTVRESAI